MRLQAFKTLGPIVIHSPMSLPSMEIGDYELKTYLESSPYTLRTYFAISKLKILGGQFT